MYIVWTQYTCIYAPLNYLSRRRSMVNSRAGAQQLFQQPASPAKLQPNPTLASADAVFATVTATLTLGIA